MKIENVDNIIELLERSKNSTCDVWVIKRDLSSKTEDTWHVSWRNESLEQIKYVEYYINFIAETSTLRFTINSSYNTGVEFTFPITDTEHAKLESFLYSYRDYYKNKTMEFLDSFLD